MMGIYFFILFLILTAVTIYFFLRGKPKLVFFLIIALAFIPRLWLINNPLLGNNDEKYHALVSKHLVADPSVPKLYLNPVLPFELNNYTGNHIWLSKPPVSMWLMATSIYVFGNHVISVRLFSLILSILSMVLLFYMGRELFGIKEGLIAMFFLAIHGTFIELGAGEISSDHVDVCFLFLTLATIYFAIKLASNTILYSLLVGLSFGLLFLTKYQASFIILPILFIIIIHKKTLRQIISQLITIVLVSTAIVLPWLFYVYNSFPTEFIAMKNALMAPFSEVIQGHSGPWYYYIDKIGKLFGEFVFIALLVVFIKFIKNQTWQMWILLLWILVPLLGFSISETKRFTYILIIAPAIFLLIGYFINQKIKLSFYPNWLQTIIYIGLIALPIRFSIERVDYFTDHTATYTAERAWKNELKNFSKTVQAEKTIIFNSEKYIEVMFYSDFTAYPTMPAKEVLESLKSEGFTCYEFKNNTYISI